MLKRVVRRALPLLAVGALALALPARAQAATIAVDIYSNYGDGSPGSFSDYVGTLVTSDVDFTDWTPFGLDAFGAHVWGILDVTANDGSAEFQMTSNDGSSLFIDGNLILSGLGSGEHTLDTFPNGVSLWEAPRFPPHPFDIYFYSDGQGDPASLALNLPGDVYYGDVPVPEPASLLLFGPAAFGLFARRRRKAA